MTSPAKLAVNGYSMALADVAAWDQFESKHAREVRSHFKLLSVYAGHRGMLRPIDRQALATARRYLTAFDAALHSPWPVLGDNTIQPTAPADWVRLHTPEREGTTWKDWRKQFLERFLALRVARNLTEKEAR